MSEHPTPGNDPSQSDADRSMTIGELSKLSGLSPSAIRFYQRRGLLPARDVDNGWQRYGRATLDRLAVIELAKSADFSLDEIVRLFDALDTDLDSVPPTEPVWRGLAAFKIEQIDVRLHRLQHMRQVLQDALEFSHLSADRAHQIPAVLGWTDEQPGAALPQPVRIPESATDLTDAAAPERTVTATAEDEARQPHSRPHI